LSRTFNGDPMSKVKIIRKVNVMVLSKESYKNAVRSHVLSLLQDEQEVPMHMSEVGHNWGEKIFQKYKSQLKIIDARWVSHKYRVPPYKTRSPVPPGPLLRYGSEWKVTARVHAQWYAANEQLEGGDYV
jgi:hypothetical protein